MDSSNVYYQLCLAADEYTLFRNSIMVQPGPMTAGQLEAALIRADKIVTLLRQLRQREAITFVGVQQVPVQPQPQAQPVPPPPQNVTQLGTSKTAWQCNACQQTMWVDGDVPPESCSACGRSWR